MGRGPRIAEGRRAAFAEGVESEEQAKSLRLLKRDEMHGYFFGKPPSVELPAKMI
jgi:EAL domain-containing protein (putative c-di-GMP-specific phosphodiesterase class I)